MKENAIMFGIIVLIGIMALFFFNIDQRTKSSQENEVPIYGMVGTANPASLYCRALGYKRRINDTMLGQVGMCIFPDGTECDNWKFYIGECGQEWSYCTLKGYNLKNSTEPERWIEGVMCLDKNTKEEVGRIFQLVNEEWKRQLTEKE